MFLRRVAATCPRSKRMFSSSVSHGYESAIQELNKEMESVFGEPPTGGLANSVSNNRANDEPELSSRNIGETSFELTHTGNSGEAQMVDVSPKESSKRTAIASGKVILGKKVFDLVLANQMAKGDVLTVAKIAGITAAKQTSNLIPLCHNIGLSHVQVDLRLNQEDFSVTIEGEAASTGKTGVEMEALTAVSIAGLTVYDMCKAASKDIAITDIRLKHKSGGKSGDYYWRHQPGSSSYGVILEHFQKEDSSMIERIRGCIVDSAPVAQPDPQVFASGFSAAFLKKNSVATKGHVFSDQSGIKVSIGSNDDFGLKPAPTEAALLLILKKFFEVILHLPAVNRRLSDVLSMLSTKQPSCPQLYMYSSADRVIPADSVESFVEAQRKAGHDVRACNFVSSPHVDHFRNDPKLYTSQLSQFLEECVLNRCKSH